MAPEALNFAPNPLILSSQRNPTNFVDRAESIERIAIFPVAKFFLLSAVSSNHRAITETEKAAKERSV
jgi:hypothetical protein